MAESETHPFKKFFGRHWEIIAALTSGLVGALALGTSTYNVYLQRQQVRASVWPHVTMGTSFADDGALSIVLRNRGVGPAQIERVRVSVGGERADDWMGALKMLAQKDTLSFVPETASLREEVLTPGMELALVKIPTGTAQDMLLAGEKRELAIDVCYCSTLEDCWTVSMSEGTKAIRACPPDPTPFVDMTDKTRFWLHEEYRKEKEAALDGGGDAAR